MFHDLRAKVDHKKLRRVQGKLDPGTLLKNDAVQQQYLRDTTPGLLCHLLTKGLEEELGPHVGVQE